MKIKLLRFQINVKKDLREALKEAQEKAQTSYLKNGKPHVISFTAPTGSGKTIILASLIEDILFGDEDNLAQENAVFLWLSDSPELNKQSKDKISGKSDRIQPENCILIDDESFNDSILHDGNIYFLNTQKLGKSGNLTQPSERRSHTIWDVLQRTATEKTDRFYVIIDEAHRGAQGDKKQDIATTIMQKFIKGFIEKKDTLLETRYRPMPIVIGMSATLARFEKLVGFGSISSRLIKVDPADVRASGLLKDRIILGHPDNDLNKEKDMMILQEAYKNWIDKCKHWSEFCKNKKIGEVNPIFLIQVESKKNSNDSLYNSDSDGAKYSDTDLDSCLKTICEANEIKFKDGEVVHTFGQTDETLKINGINVEYAKPSTITENQQIKIVFFKENLSTGWDCPRAETMMSFRRAEDSTYIAQLLGRMVRTPLGKKIENDASLNDVWLYLPKFNKDTVKLIIDELKSSNLPIDMNVEAINKNSGYQILSVDKIAQEHDDDDNEKETHQKKQREQTHHRDNTAKKEWKKGNINRSDILNALNSLQLLTNNVEKSKFCSNLTSLCSLSHLIVREGFSEDAFDEVEQDIVNMIRKHRKNLENEGKYETAVKDLTQLKLNLKTYDVLDMDVLKNKHSYKYISSNSHIERMYRNADAKLMSEGFGKKYAKCFDLTEDDTYKIDTILFAFNVSCMDNLDKYAKRKFGELQNKFRLKIYNSKNKDACDEFIDIIRKSDIITDLIFSLPRTICVKFDKDGEKCNDHLYVDANGDASIKFDSEWERDVLEEERARDDFACWYRNPKEKLRESLCLAYNKDGKTAKFYPDFIIARWNEEIGTYIFDILEPHRPDLLDNLEKAKVLARYAKTESGMKLGRIELIRKENNAYKRIDLADPITREEVLADSTKSHEDLTRIFKEYGKIGE